jgi:hypothetical protein
VSATGRKGLNHAMYDMYDSMTIDNDTIVMAIHRQRLFSSSSSSLHRLLLLRRSVALRRSAFLTTIGTTGAEERGAAGSNPLQWHQPATWRRAHAPSLLVLDDRPAIANRQRPTDLRISCLDHPMKTILGVSESGVPGAPSQPIGVLQIPPARLQNRKSALHAAQIERLSNL